MGARSATVAMLLACAWCAPAVAAADPVHDPIAHPVAHQRGLVVLIHAGGWSGPNQQRQRGLDAWPGRLLRRARWSTTSIDYAAGQDGLRSVLGELRAAIASVPRHRICVYGESSGAHLALLAAVQLPAVRCVIGLGTPTNLERWRDDAIMAGNAEWLSNWSQTAEPAFGPTPEARWEPVAAAGRLRARVLLAGQADDHVLPVRNQMTEFAALHPMTELLVTEAGSVPYLHGSFSPASRAYFADRMRAFLRGG